MRKHNGGEGNIGKNIYGTFFKLEELEMINNDYDVQADWPGYVAIGGNLGDIIWAYNPAKKVYSEIDLCNIDDDTYNLFSKSLEEFLFTMDDYYND